MSEREEKMEEITNQWVKGPIGEYMCITPQHSTSDIEYLLERTRKHVQWLLAEVERLEKQHKNMTIERNLAMLLIDTQGKRIAALEGGVRLAIEQLSDVGKYFQEVFIDMNDSRTWQETSLVLDKLKALAGEEKKEGMR